MNSLYQPPYKTPEADLFAKTLAAYSAVGLQLITDYVIKTSRGHFAIDFLIGTREGGKIGIRIIEQESQQDKALDWQEGMMLGEGHLDSVYQLRRCDVKTTINDILFCLYKLEPQAFDHSCITTIFSKASMEIKNFNFIREIDSYLCTYFNDSDMRYSYIECKRRTIPYHQTRNWKNAYDFSLEYGEASIEELRLAYEAKSQNK